MSEPQQIPADDAGTPAPSANTPPAEPSKPGGDPSWLPERLAQAQRTAQTQIFTKYGVKTQEELDAKLNRLNDLETANLSEAERTQKLIKELTPKAERATHVEALLTSLVESQFKALPESTRLAIDAVANGNPEERLKLMSVVQAAAGAAPPAAPLKPPPANTAPPGSPPPPAAQRTKFDEYQALSNPVQKQIFYGLNAQEIESSRPA